MAALADVALLVDPADEPARATLTIAVQREGWTVAVTGPASCAAVVWSDRSIETAELAALARPFLDERRLLQILWQPEDWRLSDHGHLEAPEPFVYYQALVVRHGELDGSEWTIDWFADDFSRGEEALAELARIGRLPRPRDRWNARISFWRPYRFREIVLIEREPRTGRMLRRWRNDMRDRPEVPFQTTIGNRWEVLDPATGEILDEIEVGEDQVSVRLPQRERWWAKLHG